MYLGGQAVKVIFRGGILKREDDEEERAEEAFLIPFGCQRAY